MHRHDGQENPVSRFVEVYSQTTGKKQVVPRHYLDHPVLGKNFRLTPKAKAESKARRKAETPVEQADSSSVTIDNPENGDKE